MHLAYNDTSYALCAYGPLTIVDIASLHFNIHLLCSMMCNNTLMQSFRIIFEFISFVKLFFYFFKSYLLDLNFICPGCGITYWMSTGCSNGQSIDYKNTWCKTCASFLINLTTLNDQIIDKYLLFILNLYQVTYGLDLHIVMTALCRRYIRVQGPCVAP